MSKTNKNSQLKSPYKIFKKKKIHRIKPIKIQNRINEKKKKKGGIPRDILGGVSNSKNYSFRVFFFKFFLIRIKEKFFLKKK